MMHGNNKTVTVNRKDLILKLEQNLALHITDYAEAIIGYKIKIENDLAAELTSVKCASPEIVVARFKGVQANPPINYEKQYKDAIEMMSWSVGDTIELDQTTFKAYVQNEWTWSQAVSVSNTFYKSIAASSGVL